MITAAAAGRRRDVRRVVAMEVVSGVGDGVFWVGLLAIMLDRGVGAGGFALAALARLGPRAVISAPAGVLADRIDRRRLLVSIDVARAASMVALALAATAGASLAVLLGTVLVSYTLAAPYRPALTAAMPMVAGERGLSAANALVGTTRQVMTFIGPLIGAAVVSWTGPSVAFWIDAVTFLIAAVLLLTTTGLTGRRAGHDRGLAAHRVEWRRDMFGGWHDIRSTAGLGVITSLVFVMYTARGAELVLYALLAQQRLEMGSAGTGVLTGAVGLGALLAVPLASRVAEAGRADLVMLGAVLSTAVPVVLLGAFRSPVAACAALMVVGAGVVVFEVLSVVLLQRLAERDVLGRVFGLIGTASNAGKLIGAMAAPLIVASLDLPGTFVVVGVAVGVAGTAAVPALTGLTRAARRRRDELRPVVDVLASLRLFDGASPFALERMASAMAEQKAFGGEVVIRQGAPADDLYVVRTGQLTVVENGTVVNELRPGDWFGEIGLLRQRPRRADVVADGPCVLWRIEGEVFLEALEDDASESSALMDVMADRLARSRAAARPPA